MPVVKERRMTAFVPWLVMQTRESCRDEIGSARIYLDVFNEKEGAMGMGLS